MNGKTPLTTKQAKILGFIENQIAAQGRPPTIREIAKHFGLSAVGTVQDHLRALKKKGFLEHKAGVACGSRPAYRAEAFSVPVLGTVPAGRPVEAIEDATGFLALPQNAPGRAAGKVGKLSELFGLKVKGDSMMEAGILDGDYVVVKKTTDVQDGDIVVATIDGEATVKTLEKRKGRVRLLPANPKFSPIELDPERENLIQGKVVSLQRYY